MILNVSNLSHGFGDRGIFNDVSFRLLKGEHIGQGRQTQGAGAQAGAPGGGYLRGAGQRQPVCGRR